MRILAVSDIHGHVESVRQLRDREPNEFDVVVVAGDIDGLRDTADEVMAILRSFDCPVVYIFGNWDNKLSYDHDFGPNAHHIHLRSVEVGGWSFVGMSGLPANWGRNPIAAAIREQVGARHEPVFREHSAAVAEAEVAVERHAAECLAEIAIVRARSKDPAGAAHQRRVAQIEYARSERDRAANAARRAIEATDAYAAFRAELTTFGVEIAGRNRSALAAAVASSPTGPERTIVISHERLHRTAEDMPGVPLFLFGHRHRFENVVSGGARHVNVSALEMRFWIRPVGAVPSDPVSLMKYNPGGYVVIDLERNDIAVRSVRFSPVPDGWERLPADELRWTFSVYDEP
jgi:hypothetical protein